MQTRKHHKWTIEEEELLYANNNLSPLQIKLKYFNRDNSISVQSIADKKSRVTDRKEQPNYGKPWYPSDERELKKFIELGGDQSKNEFLKYYFGRGSKELDQAKWDLKHHGRINRAKNSKRALLIPKSTNKISKSKQPFDDQLEIKFANRNGLVTFTMKKRVRGNLDGNRDLVGQLRLIANTLEKNKDFTLNQ